MVTFFTRVRDLENNKIGKVIDDLSVQFTAEFNDKIRFYFYKDQGVTWTPITSEADDDSN